ncbi:MAG: hypothetical protein NT056_09345 [Proteobacteria bacterium]|nr:hypothetical protein [Pseudomonadota bacterium]
MIKPKQFGCKKCGGVITVEAQVLTDRVDVKVKDGKVYDYLGEVQIQCRKCSSAVSILSIEQKK